VIDGSKTGRVRVHDFGEDFSATWRVVGDTVEVTSKYGIATASLAGLRTSPGIIAQEKLREVVKTANRVPKASAADKARFNPRDG